jgi:hypothetical protein
MNNFFKNKRLRLELNEVKELLEIERRHSEQLEELAKKFENAKVNIVKEIIKYTRVDYYEKNDPAYIEAIAKLLDDSRFTFFLEDTMHDFVLILQKINPGDPDSMDKRTKAALRMDGIQFLINKLAEIRGSYLKSLISTKEESSNGVQNA